MAARPPSARSTAAPSTQIGWVTIVVRSAQAVTARIGYPSQCIRRRGGFDGMNLDGKRIVTPDGRVQWQHATLLAPERCSDLLGDGCSESYLKWNCHL